VEDLEFAVMKTDNKTNLFEDIFRSLVRLVCEFCNFKFGIIGNRVEGGIKQSRWRDRQDDFEVRKHKI
jgi:hypothetical protein